jgi:hypothetical protein
MAERSKYESFLRELDKGGASKPAHVVAKVRADYTAKLTDAVERLKANHEVLSAHAATLTGVLHKLEESERQIVDEHAETELRKQVGELTETEWELSSKKAESLLMKIKQQQQVAAADINRIREILAGVSATDSLAKPAVVDELAFLKSVVGSAGSGSHIAHAAPAPPQSASAAPPRPSVVRPMPPPSLPAPPTPPARRPSLIEPDPMSVPSAASSAATPVVGMKPVPRPTPPRESLVEKPLADVKINARNTDDAPLASSVPDGDIQLRPRAGAATQKKTLKCAECGTLNTPSEWYCERCGAELTQL